MPRLDGKIALVTGAASGLGEADATMFVNEGATVVLADVNTERGEQLADKLGPRTTFAELDVRHEAAWQSVIATIRAAHGRLDVLVNNAGVVRFGTPETVDELDYRLILSVSLDGTVFGCKHAIPIMRETGGGSIINMSSIASIQGEPYCAAYCAAKGGIEAYTRAVAVYCAQNQLGIRCNSVHPAAIDTPMVRSAGELADQAGLTELLANDRASLANPVGEPTDVAHLITYLASDEAKFVSGQKFVIDQTASVTAGQVPGGQSVADL